ncbi:MAG: hypothetical protein A2Z25_17785 [Planctomycetes bacterium RBG_16_55_9]|nr:MAG: hypothetical protein A2Z25_17785 [Planctomycetes bacterium RBG_16_55_9]
MDGQNELRTEHRLLYRWPIWITDDATGQMMQGQMVDISSEAASFTCYAYEVCLSPSQQITAHFSVPLCGLGGSFAVRNFTRSGYAYRVDQVNKVLHRVTAQFIEPLPFRPGEQTCNEADMIALLQILSSPKG